MKNNNSNNFITLCRDVEKSKYYISTSTEVKNSTIVEVSQKCFSELFLCMDNIYTSSKKTL